MPTASEPILGVWHSVSLEKLLDTFVTDMDAVNQTVGEAASTVADVLNISGQAVDLAASVASFYTDPLEAIIKQARQDALALLNVFYATGLHVLPHFLFKQEDFLSSSSGLLRWLRDWSFSFFDTGDGNRPIILGDAYSLQAIFLWGAPDPRTVWEQIKKFQEILNFQQWALLDDYFNERYTALSEKTAGDLIRDYTDGQSRHPDWESVRLSDIDGLKKVLESFHFIIDGLNYAEALVDTVKRSVDLMIAKATQILEYLERINNALYEFYRALLDTGGWFLFTETYGMEQLQNAVFTAPNRPDFGVTDYVGGIVFNVVLPYADASIYRRLFAPLAETPPALEQLQRLPWERADDSPRNT